MHLSICVSVYLSVAMHHSQEHKPWPFFFVEFRRFETKSVFSEPAMMQWPRNAQPELICVSGMYTQQMHEDCPSMACGSKFSVSPDSGNVS